jgi:hypothetical protein
VLEAEQEKKEPRDHPRKRKIETIGRMGKQKSGPKGLD